MCKCYELSVKDGDHNHNTLLKIWKERNKTFDTAITAFELSELRKKFEMYNSFSDIINDERTDEECDSIGCDKFDFALSVVQNTWPEFGVNY